MVGYVSNKTIHEDVQISIVKDKTKRLARNYFIKFQYHQTEIPNHLNPPPKVPKRLKKQWA